jgi:oxygen-independent coproporphyrinogen-3 oxidase
MIGDQQASLYFHIPFCSRKCSYCHFYVIPESEEAKDLLLEGILKELDLYASHLKDKEIVSLYFGGGTPSLFGPWRIEQIIQKVSDCCRIAPNSEITLEANPENLTKQLMRQYAKAGINRTSIGVQSLDSSLLQLLGRRHDGNTAIHSVLAAHEAGIDNISIDLMYDLPKQTVKHWASTLEQVRPLPIRHLSLYNLTIEPHTLFFKQQASLRPLLPDEEASFEMYQMAVDRLDSMGLQQYEISAFAVPGSESRHNSGYWTGRQFLGLGPSAFSYWQKKRFRNIAHLKRYCEIIGTNRVPVDFEETLDPDAARRELFVINLRLRQGVALEQFSSHHGPLDKATENAIDRLLYGGFLTLQEGHVRLTKQGILFYDSVAAELI